MLHTPNGTVAPEFEDLERRIRNGDGILWTGDQRLWLGIGILENRFTRKTGRRLEVWRDNEDGTTVLVGHWLMSEQFRVLFDLANMRLDRPGAVDAVTRIEQHNEKLEAEASAKNVEKMYDVLDHALHLDHDRNNPKTKFHFSEDPIAVPKAPEATAPVPSPPVQSGPGTS